MMQGRNQAPRHSVTSVLGTALAGGLLVAGVLACGSAAWAEEEPPFGELVSAGRVSDFIDSVGGPIGSTFEVIFSPDLLTWTYGSGVFVPPFDSEPRLETLDRAVQAELVCIGSPFWFPERSCRRGQGATGVYQLLNDITFEYSNGVSVSWGAGTSFDYFFFEPFKVEFNLSYWRPNEALVSGLPGQEPFRTNEVAFRFNERGFQQLIDIPTPAPILGVGIALRFSRRLRKRIKASAARPLATKA